MQPQYGDIYLLPFGKGKQRPVVAMLRDVINDGDSIVVVPFTTQKLEERRDKPYCVFVPTGVGGGTMDRIAKADEITRIFKDDIDWTKGKLGRLPNEYMVKIIRAIRYVIRDPDLSADMQSHDRQVLAASQSKE